MDAGEGARPGDLPDDEERSALEVELHLPSIRWKPRRPYDDRHGPLGRRHALGQPEEVSARTFGDVSVVTGKAKVVLTSDGNDREIVIRNTDVWVKRDGRWQWCPGPPRD